MTKCDICKEKWPCNSTKGRSMELHLYANFLNNTPLDQLARMYDLAPWKVDDIIMKIKHDFAEPSKNMKTDERFQS